MTPPESISAWLVDRSLVTIIGVLPPRDPNDDDDEEEEEDEKDEDEEEEPAVIREPEADEEYPHPNVKAPDYNENKKPWDDGQASGRPRDRRTAEERDELAPSLSSAAATWPFIFQARTACKARPVFCQPAVGICSLWRVGQ